MTENELAKKIIFDIDNNPNKMIEATIHDFLSLWFKNKKFNDTSMTAHLFRFSKKYNLNYVLILHPGKGAVAIRFWRKAYENEQKKLDIGEIDQSGSTDSAASTDRATE